MRKLITLSALATSLVILASFSAPSPAVPALADKPVKWEYAELSARTGARAFGKGGIGADQPPPGGLQPATALPIRFITADGEVTAGTWQEMAEKLKAPEAKKDIPASSHRIRVFNHLGADGWELVGGTPSGTTPAAITSGGGVWTFKRRVQ